MRIARLRLRNFGPFAAVDELPLGMLTTIVGQNDAGKSHVLRALAVFFAGRLDPSDIHNSGTGVVEGLTRSSAIEIEIALSDLPPLALEGEKTTLAAERLVDAAGELRLRRVWQADSPDKCETVLLHEDFADETCARLPWRKERDLNERLRALAPDLAIEDLTAAQKRAEVRRLASERGIARTSYETILGARDPIWKALEPLLPRIELFETDTRLGVGETTFQGQFRPIVRVAAEDERVTQARGLLSDGITAALQEEVAAIFGYLRRHTSALAGLEVRPTFNWEKAVTFEIVGRDQHGVATSLDERGSGMRRLLMVAFFQHLATRHAGEARNVIYAVEEPENCLHPGLQRELAASFRELVTEGTQLLITSHSPVFAGASAPHDLILVERGEGVSRAAAAPEPARVAEELGIEPADSITGYGACVFVEGPADVRFLRAVAARFREAGLIAASFEERNIGVLPSGGHNLKQWITLRALTRLNRRFAAVIDSDRTSPDDPLSHEKEAWRAECEAQGGTFHVLRKREIENYLHPRALARAGFPRKRFDDYTDMKKHFGNKRISEVIEGMSAAEILERDRYEDANGEERHELLDLVRQLLTLPETTPRGRKGSGSRGSGRAPAQSTARGESDPATVGAPAKAPARAPSRRRSG